MIYAAGNNIQSDNKVSPTIILLGASFTTGNMGVGALTAGLIKCAFEKYKAPKIYIIEDDADPGEYRCIAGKSGIRINHLRINFSKNIFNANNIYLLLTVAFLAKFIRSKKIKRTIFRKFSSLNTILSADIIGAISGGDSFADIYGFGAFAYIALPQILSLLMGKTIVQFPQTYGPFRQRITRIFARWILEKSSFIFARDEASIRDVQKVLGADSQKKVLFHYDVGFGVDPIPPNDNGLLGIIERTNTPVIGLNISGLLFIGGYTRRNMFRLKIEYPRFIYALIEFIMEQTTASMILIPHVFGQKPEADIFACQKVFADIKDRYFGRIINLENEYNQNEIKYIIGKTDFFIGSRMHACIAALSQGIPTVSLAYSKKFAGVMKSIGVEELVVDPRIYREEEILDRIHGLYALRSSYRKKLDGSMQAIRKNAVLLFDRIDRL